MTIEHAEQYTDLPNLSYVPIGYAAHNQVFGKTGREPPIRTPLKKDEVLKFSNRCPPFSSDIESSSIGESVNNPTTPEERQFRLTPEERSSWEENGYFVRHNVFTEEENDLLTQVADAIALGKIPFPDHRIFQNALVRDGKVEASGCQRPCTVFIK